MTLRTSVAPPAEMPDPAPPPPRERRPFGLIAIILLLFFQMLGGVIVVVGYWYFNPDIFDFTSEPNQPLDWFLFALIVQPLLSVATFAAMIGLWLRRRWAWFLTLMIVTYGMASDLLTYYYGEIPSDIFLSMFLNVATVFYLNLSEVQRLFVSKPAGDRK